VNKIISFFMLFLVMSTFAQTTKDSATKNNASIVKKNEAVKNTQADFDNKKDVLAIDKKGVNKTSSAINISTASISAKNANKDVGDDEYSEVMTDVMESDSYANLDYSSNEDQSKGYDSFIPNYYGKVKGTLMDGGKSLLVLENEDGTIYILQIFQGKDGVYFWKLAGKFDRN